MNQASLYIGCTAAAVARAETDAAHHPAVDLCQLEWPIDGPDAVRTIVDAVKYRPVEAPYRLLLVYDLGGLSPGAQHALHRVLDDPPTHVRIAICARSPADVPMPIFKRCRIVVAD